MSALEKFLAKAGKGYEMLGHAGGEAVGKGLRGAAHHGVAPGAMYGAANAAEHFAEDHPRIAGGMMHGGLAGLGAGAALGANKIDDLTRESGADDDDVAAALEAIGERPGDYEGKAHPMVGAMEGGSLGALANFIGRRGAPGKYAGLGALGGALLGGSLRTYHKKDRHG